MMIIYPAIDIKEGQVVRLLEGDPNQKTVYASDPAEVAKRWQDEGAEWVHVINLDGALDSDAVVWDVLEKIAALGLSIQYGGGLRDKTSVQQAINSGVKRAIIGTAAVKNPPLVEELVQLHGAEAVVIAVDARGDKVATHGWQKASDRTVVEFAKSMQALGVEHVLYTDIQRDGMLQGVNIAATRHLAEQTGLQVVASGGLKDIDDVIALKKTEVIAGVILGKALYENMISLPDALRIANEG